MLTKLFHGLSKIDAYQAIFVVAVLALLVVGYALTKVPGA